MWMCISVCSRVRWCAHMRRAWGMRWLLFLRVVASLPLRCIARKKGQSLPSRVHALFCSRALLCSLVFFILSWLGGPCFPTSACGAACPMTTSWRARLKTMACVNTWPPRLFLRSCNIFPSACMPAPRHPLMQCTCSLFSNPCPARPCTNFLDRMRPRGRPVCAGPSGCASPPPPCVPLCWPTTRRVRSPPTL